MLSVRRFGRHRSQVACQLAERLAKLGRALDDTLGPALVATLEADQFAPTIELKVNFIRPAKAGRLEADGRIVHKGRSVAFLQGEIRDSEGRLLATATATAQLPRAD
jgi:uncharacterized protein (TIGR00369 family)